jgi:hypothetical protein
MKRNAFLTAALESLQQDTAVQSATTEPSIATTTPAVGGVSNAADAPAVTETNVDTAGDAVAELMEKNQALEDANSELQTEVFDNDLDAIETVGDTVNQDLEEAVAAGVALEELAYIANFAAKNGQATKAGVAGFAMALEQLTYRGGLDSAMPALEEEAKIHLGDPIVHSEVVSSTAKAKAKEIGQRLIAGIKKIVAWVLGAIRTLFARGKVLGEKAKALQSQINSIDETMSISSSAFVASLRLLDISKTPSEQFEEYAEFANGTLYGTFGPAMGKRVLEATTELNSSDVSDGARGVVNDKILEVLKSLFDTVYIETATAAGTNAEGKGEGLTLGQTPMFVGGVQLYLAASMTPSTNWHCRAGLSKTVPVFITDDSIKVVQKSIAANVLQSINKWMSSSKSLEATFDNLTKLNDSVAKDASMASVHQYMSMLTAIATGCVPHLLRANIQNSANFIAYVEKSIAVSKGGPAPEAK